MSARVKSIKRKMKNNHMKEFMETMLGVGGFDVDIIIPKHINVLARLSHIYKLFAQMATLPILRETYPEYVESLDEINMYANKIHDTFMLDKVLTEEELHKHTKEQVNTLYKTLKEQRLIQELVILCGKLKPYQVCLNMQPPDDSFVYKEAGIDFKIFPFSNLDLKKIWYNDKTTKSCKHYIMSMLRVLFDDAYEIFKITTSADVDKTEISKVMIMFIDEIKKIPKLNRCTKAFNILKNGASLIENNFDTYYRDMVSSGNPNIILESYIVDIADQNSKTPGSTASMMEFKMILSYLNEVRSSSMNTQKAEKLKSLFSTTENLFGMYDKSMNGEIPAPNITDKQSYSTYVKEVINMVNEQESADDDQDSEDSQDEYSSDDNVE